jgi:CRP/FNR family transcriptional regulator, cyclic AMP receptor protein
MATPKVDLSGVRHTVACHRAHETLYAQGDRCTSVMYVQAGSVRFTVTSPAGRTAVVSTLHAGDFFGQGALAGQQRHRCTAETMTASTILSVPTREMRRGLRSAPALASRFRSQLLRKNVRGETEVLLHVFNGLERRLARALLLLARFDEHHLVRAALPIISRTLLAEMIGASRWKVDLLMSGFRKRGFLERHSVREGGVQVHRSLLRLVLQE